jgi:hypothetical protein
MKLKPQFKSDYEKYVAINSTNKDLHKIVVAGEVFMHAIDEAKSFDEAETILKKSKPGKALNSGMLGQLMMTVIYFHSRGDEVKEWWNSKSKKKK